MGFRDRLRQGDGLLSGTGLLEGLPQGGLLQGLGSKLMNRRRRGVQGDMTTAGMDPVVDPPQGVVDAIHAVFPHEALQPTTGAAARNAPSSAPGIPGRRRRPAA